MEIRIDTKRDSVDDIKKAIKFLQEFVDSGDSQTPDAPAGAFSMFSNESDSPGSDEDKKDDDVEIKPMIEPY